MSEVILEVKNLAKFFDATKVLKDINLTVNKGDVIAIIGPSGAGKSTFLRCLNLLEEPTRGVLSFEGHEYFSIEKCKDDFVDYEKYNRAKEEYDVRIVEAEDNLAIYQNLRIEGDKTKENKQKIEECKKIYKDTLKSKPNNIDYFNQKAYDEFIKDHPVLSIGETARNKLRTKMTMVFQSFNLFNNMDVLRNCTLAQEKVLHR